jgi:hypothetical protein
MPEKVCCTFEIREPGKDVIITKEKEVVFSTSQKRKTEVVEGTSRYYYFELLPGQYEIIIFDGSNNIRYGRFRITEQGVWYNESNIEKRMPISGMTDTTMISSKLQVH